jgi:archaellum component FlaC
MDKIEREESWNRYLNAIMMAQEKYENAVGSVKRECERVNKKAFRAYKEDIERARKLIKDIKWNSEDEFTLRSY